MLGTGTKNYCRMVERMFANIHDGALMGRKQDQIDCFGRSKWSTLVW